MLFTLLSNIYSALFGEGDINKLSNLNQGSKTTLNLEEIYLLYYFPNPCN